MIRSGRLRLEDPSLFAPRLYMLLVSLCRVATGIAFGVLIVSVLIQVIARTFLPESPVWTEELTRYALLYLAACGVGLSFRNGELVNVDIVCEIVPRPVRKALMFVSAALTAVFAFALLKPASMFVSIGALQTSSAMGIRMDFIQVTIFILLALLGLFAVLRIVRILSGVSDGTPEDSTKDFP